MCAVSRHVYLSLVRARVHRVVCCFFFFQAEDGIRDLTVTGVQTCALPISFGILGATLLALRRRPLAGVWLGVALTAAMFVRTTLLIPAALAFVALFAFSDEIGRASCRERV